MSGESGDTDTNYTLIETTRIAEISEVRLYEETWAHIAQEHPEFANRLPSLDHAVVDTIVNPTTVTRSTTDPVNGYVFFSGNNLKGDKGMSVPVKLVEGTSGRVATAMFRGDVKGEILYRDGDDA